MGVVLYRKGNTHRVRDIDCELTVIKPENFTGEPEPGWFFSPEEAYQEIDNGLQEEIKTEEAKEEIAIDPVVKDITIKEAKCIDGMDNDEIRAAAKLAGIEKYKTARIETLKRLLKA